MVISYPDFSLIVRRIYFPVVFFILKIVNWKLVKL